MIIENKEFREARYSKKILIVDNYNLLYHPLELKLQTFWPILLLEVLLV